MAKKTGIKKQPIVLVISSDEGFAGRMGEFVKKSGGALEVLPLAGLSPTYLKKKICCAIVDCRHMGGMAQTVIEKLHSADAIMPVLAITDKDGRDLSDRLYGAGASICLPDTVGDLTLENMVKSLYRLRQTHTQYEHLQDILKDKKEKLKKLEKELEETKIALAKRVQEQITLYRATRAMLSVFDFDALANEIIELATRELGAEVGSLMLIEGEYLVVRALAGHVPGEDEILGRKQKIGEGISGWVAREGKPLLITDIDKHEMFRERGGVRYKTKSCVSSPIIARGRIRGVINITNKKGGRHFTEDDLRLLRTLAMTAAIALDNFELIEQIKRAETMSSIGELATRMAHEIRNPLHAIKMTIQILEKKFTFDESDREYFDILIGEIERLETLVREVLSFARKDQLEIKKCDLNALMERTLAVFKGVVKEKNITVETSWDAELPMVDVDEKKIEQAVMNLVINAIEAMKPGGRLKLSTKLSTLFAIPLSQYGEEIEEKPRVNTKFAVITVSDNGVGIEKHFADKIFTPFFTTKVHGTGLGLSTTRKIVEAHGGRLTFTSAPQVGTTFFIELPIKE